MEDPQETYIRRVEDPKGVHYKCTSKGIDASWDDFLKLGLVALRFQGHESTLFRRHQSFKIAAPIMSVSKPLRSVAKITLKKLKRRFKSNLTSLLEGIFRLPFTQDGSTSEMTQDKPYLQGVLMTFLPYPALAYNEVHLEYSSSKHVVSGSYDVIVGSETNGDKPVIKIEDSRLALHLGSVLEVKSTFTRLATRDTSSSESSSFTERSEDLKQLIQPMLEVMAISQVADFPNADVPVVNFLGNKFVFRSLLYFKGVDVVLTTPRVLHLRTVHDTIDALGDNVYVRAFT